MNTKIKRHSRSVISVILAVCMLVSCMTVGLIATDAARIAADESVGADVSGYVYFVKPSAWTNAALMIGKNSDWTDCYQMTNIDGTNMYYTNTVAWTDSTATAFVDVPDTWGSEKNSVASRRTHANHYTDTRTSAYTTNYTYYVTATENSSGSKDYTMSVTNTSTNTSTGYNSLNNTLTVKTMYSSNGGSTYAESNTKYGTFSASGAKYMTGNGTSSDSSISQSGGTGTLSTARTNTATISQNPEPGYIFVGWSVNNNGTGVSEGGYYSFTNAGSNATVYAYYKRSTTPLTAPTVSNVTATAAQGSNVTLTVSNHDFIHAQNSGVTYKLYTDAEGTTEASDYTDNGNGTISIPAKASNTGTYYVQAVANNSASYHESDLSSPVSVTINKTQISAAPTISVNRTTASNANYTGITTANDTDTVKVAVTNYSSNVGTTGKTYSELFDFAVVGGTQKSQESGVISLNALTGSLSGSDYTLSVNATLKETYREYYKLNAEDNITSVSSTTSTVKVYSPVYSLFGNVDNTYIAGSEATRGWDVGYQSKVAVNVPDDAHPGVYSITFTTLTEDEIKAMGHKDNTTINIGLYNKDEAKQYAFARINGESYEWYNYYTSDGSTDYTVPGAGVADATKLYVHTITDTEHPGGSLVFAPNTTFVYTIDQTKHFSDTQKNGQVFIDVSKATVRVKAKVQTFNATKGTYNSLMDATDSVGGTVTAVPSTDNKHFNSMITATPATGYEFVGWYTDEACTEEAFVSDNDVATKSVTDVSVNQLYYAKFEQTKPTERNVTVTVSSGHGTVVKQSGASGDSSPYTAYEGATIKFNARPDEGYVIQSVSAVNANCSRSDNVITLINITGDVTLTVVYKGEIK